MHPAPPARGLFLQRLLLALLLCATNGAGVWAQPVIAWDRTLGGESYEELNALEILPDGIIAGGSTRSGVAFGSPSDFSWNILITKLDFNGNPVWQRTYGADQDERLWTLIPTRDGGFVAGGYSYSGINGDKTEPSRGDRDVWIIKIDAQGQLLWDKTFGGLFQDELFSLLEMPDGGFLLGCHSNSNISGDKTENSLGLHDVWMIRTDASGNMLWDKTIGGSGYEQINDLIWAPDGAVYGAGGTTSAANDGNLGPETAHGGMDFLLMKMNPANGSLYWTRRFGGAGEDYPYSLCLASNGRLYMGGRSGSMPGPAGPFNNGKTAAFYGGDSDYWMLELDTDGRKMREWSFGGSGLDDLYFIQEQPCDGLVLGGVSDSDISGNKTAAHRGSYDYWIVSIGPDGQKRWEQTLGGTGGDALTRMAAFPDGSLLFGGHSDSQAGFEKTSNSLGVNDFWIVGSSCQSVAQITVQGPQSPCSDEPLTLDATVSGCNGCHYQWSTGDTTASIEVLPGTNGSFSVLVCNENGCAASDTVEIATYPPLIIDLGADIQVNQATQLSVPGAQAGWTYQWSTGASTPTITVTQSGIYTVTVTDQNGCTATDAVQVTLKKTFHVWVPNAFSPNGDGYSDYLPVYSDDPELLVRTFQIADRWGDLCFRRDNFIPAYDWDGWDGRWRGKEAAAGVYAWFALVEFSNGEILLLEGDVSLIR